jgi:DNA polymerase-3 subunit gamma/tau
MNPTSHINLARKLRPKNFSQVVGQDIAVKMLCNGLALGKLFPTYVFSGQRGCGKTTTARIFAGALNCKNLAQILKSKSLNMPCNECASCQMMLATTHPDFIEIDAASNTGVDNVRQVLETATYLPIVGNKKIYLIDEAHMLSKSAFNALLKMLEEPPKTAVFMLATTELHKIPDTVRSRCFQAFFRPVEENTVQSFLSKICAQEKLSLSPNVLKTISERCEGSLRDSLNLLEQLSWACMEEATATQEATAIAMLGLTSNEDLFALGKTVILQDPAGLIEKLSSINLAATKPELLWQDFALFLSTMLKCKLGAKECSQSNYEEFAAVAKDIPLAKLKQITQLFWNNEAIFMRTIQKHLFLEHLLLQMASIDSSSPSTAQPKAVTDNPVITSVMKPNKAKLSMPQSPSLVEPQLVPAQPAAPCQATILENMPLGWRKFLSNPELCADKLLISIFKQVVKLEFKDAQVIIFITGLNDFFERKIEESRALTLRALMEHFPSVADFYLKAAALTPEAQLPLGQAKQISEQPARLPLEGAEVAVNLTKNPQGVRKTLRLDTSNQNTWPKSNLLTKLFGGKVERVL